MTTSRLICRLSLALLGLSLLEAASAAEPASDACAALLPSALASKLSSELPAYQAPSSADAGEPRSKQIGAAGDWPCPFIVLGDFDGNGSLDRALLLKPRQPGNARLIGVMNNNGQWQITLSEEWPLSLADSELRPEQPGFFQREAAIKQPTEQLDQLASLQAENAGFSVGKVNGQAALYAVVNGRWQKLTLRE